MFDEKNKAKYKPTEVYVGTIMCNAGNEGYYATSPEAFIKKIDQEGNLKYEKLNRGEQFPMYTEGTPSYVSVSNICCLTELIPEDKRDQYMSETVIKLYLMKYNLNNFFSKENNLNNFKKTKNRK